MSTLRVAESMLDLIGGTPMVSLSRLGKGLKPKIYAKLEFLNPGGSVKDRIGLSMLLDAERKGLIRPGFTIVEPTSGNTGVGLALAAILRGYKVVFTVPDKMSRDKVDLLRAVGAKVRVTPSNVSPGDPASYVEVAKKFVRDNPGSFMPNQYENMANPGAHYATTGPEIWAQTEGKIDVLVAGVGTGGTISGTGRYLKERNPRIEVVGVDPEGSILASAHGSRKSKPRPYRVEGIGEDFLPGTLDMKVIDRFVTVTDGEALLMTRRLAREEGILGGTSSGAAVYGALEVAKDLGSSKTIVVILPDTGRSYLNKVFNDDWMSEQGIISSSGVKVPVRRLLQKKPKGALRLQVISPTQRLSTAFERMSKLHISNLPVVENGVQIGNISLRSLLRNATPVGRRSKVVDLMDAPLPRVDVAGAISISGGTMGDAGAVLVMDHNRPVDILTTSDVINYLARR